MKSVAQKKRPGRPATGQAPIIALRLSADEIALIDEFAAELGVDRSKAFRTLLREGLAAYNRKKRRDEAARRRAAAINETLVEDVLAGRHDPEPAPAALSPRPPRGRGLTREQIKGIADRAEQRSRKPLP